MRTSLIVAADEGDVIGRDNGLPWHFPADLIRFKALTLRHVVVAGRRTHDSIVARIGRPLPDRFTVVVTGRPIGPGSRNVIFQPDVATALDVAVGIEAFAGRGEVFVIGGARVYAQLLNEVDRVYLTRVHQRTDGDAIMPPGWLDHFSLIDEEASGDRQFSFLTYDRK